MDELNKKRIDDFITESDIEFLSYFSLSMNFIPEAGQLGSQLDLNLKRDGNSNANRNWLGYLKEKFDYACADTDSTNYVLEKVQKRFKEIEKKLESEEPNFVEIKNQK